MRPRIGVQIHPQHCTMDDLLQATRKAEEMGAESIFTWDHFFPLYGQPDSPMQDPPQTKSPHAGDHFEAWVTLTAMACHTKKADIGLLVGCNSYRNPQLVADMARTLDHVSNGRAILGIGSGWFQKDYDEYGYEFGTAIGRLKDLEKNLPVIKERLGKLTPPPKRQPLPLMIGGSGEKVTLRLVAEHATMWNGFGPPEEFGRKNRILDDWCAKVGRNPKEVERTVAVFSPSELKSLDGFVEQGAEHIIVGAGWPFDETLDMLKAALQWREQSATAKR